jgi:hypothetical protein
MPQRTTESTGLFFRQFRVSHGGHINQTAHTQQRIQEETVDKKLVGTQYMFPTFFGRGGLRITVKYKPETKD